MKSIVASERERERAKEREREREKGRERMEILRLVSYMSKLPSFHFSADEDKGMVRSPADADPLAVQVGDFGFFIFGNRTRSRRIECR